MTAPMKTKKEIILDVSLRLFSEKGFKPTSVRDIAVVYITILKGKTPF